MLLQVSISLLTSTVYLSPIASQKFNKGQHRYHLQGLDEWRTANVKDGVKLVYSSLGDSEQDIKNEQLVWILNQVNMIL